MQYPYDESDAQTKGGIGSAHRSRQPTPSLSASTPYDDLSVFDLSFPECQWATAEDMLSLDLYQYQGDPFYFSAPGFAGGNELWNQMPSVG